MVSSSKMLSTSTQWSQSSTSDDLPLSAKFFPRIKPKKPYCSRRVQNETFPQDDEPCLMNIAVDHGLQQSEASEHKLGQSSTYEMLSSSVQWSQSSTSDELSLSIKFFPKIKDNRLYNLGQVNNEPLFKKSTAPCLTNIDASNSLSYNLSSF